VGSGFEPHWRPPTG